jgi:hypothetical protein
MRLCRRQNNVWSAAQALAGGLRDRVTAGGKADVRSVLQVDSATRLCLSGVILLGDCFTFSSDKGKFETKSAQYLLMVVSHCTSGAANHKVLIVKCIQ